MCSQTTLDSFAVEVAAFLIEERLRPDEDPRRAEAALEGTGRCEGVGEADSLFNLESFEGRDRLAFRLFHRDETTLNGLAVEQHGARSALPGWRAAVLGGCDPEFFAKGGEEVRVIGGDLYRESIDGERSGFHR